MSLDFLKTLNGEANGRFATWIAAQTVEPRICWYPSAGTDFRDLLFLHPAMKEKNPSAQNEPTGPSMFLHTDYMPPADVFAADAKILHRDGRTTIEVTHREELPACNVPLDPQIAVFPDEAHTAGRVVFMEVEVTSGDLGTVTLPVLYVSAENEAFCALKALAAKAKFSHIVHVRYGAGFGGGRASGAWLWNVLKPLGCEVFLHDQHDQLHPGDAFALAKYPALRGAGERPTTMLIRTTPGESWSDHGDVAWLQLA
jgi:hypothetical protein